MSIIKNREMNLKWPSISQVGLGNKNGERRRHFNFVSTERTDGRTEKRRIGIGGGGGLTSGAATNFNFQN